uniref:pentatricopeptide repeat-containing protein At1g08070, chloroplastic-like n=1 Tax=Erigeron canadensis TaxID=72917 RepID=UPI001CB97740|nr:pentatricopeptide repeat-containing protein At1g08070, chloroplastic-like [Erigeron canadensis]
MENIINGSPWSYSIQPIHKQDSIFVKLECCKSIKELKQIHCYVIKLSPHQKIQQSFYKKIITISPKFNILDLAYIHSLFSKLDIIPTVKLYNTIIRSFGRNHPLLALLFYRDMLEKGFYGDSFTYPYVLKACTHLCTLEHGQMIHSQVVKNGFVMNLYVVNMLIRFYSECDHIECAQKVFDKSSEKDLVTWTTLIQGYVDIGCFEKGVELFEKMCGTGLIADEMTMVVLISACAKLRDSRLGMKLQKYMYDHGLNVNDVYICNAMIDMYMKCGDASLAGKVFNDMSVKNVVSWNSMILGFVQQGEFQIALDVFNDMKNRGVKCDDVTLVGVLNCCANLGTLEQGKWVHSYIDRIGIKVDGFVGNALIDMYMKCGLVEKAKFVFNHMKRRDVYTYTSMIAGLAMNGKGEKALEVFAKMLELGSQPNDVTYVGILMACSHSGLVKEGCRHFVEMQTVYNIRPQKEHYGCMVDLLGRAGLLTEAEDFIEHMTIEPDDLVWGALLSGCRIHGNVEIGERVMDKLDELDAEKDGAYILMSNLLSSSYRWKDAFKLREAMKERKIKKTPGCSSVEVDGVVYEFQKGDKSHGKTKEIYMLLDIMENHLKNSGQIID